MSKKKRPEVVICMRTFSGMFKGKAYKRTEFLRESIKSFKDNTTIPYHLVLIDDKSEDADQVKLLNECIADKDIDFVRIKGKHKGRQHTFALQKKLGYETGLPYIYICDDDFTYQKGWLKELLDSYKALQKSKKKKKVGILSPFSRKDWPYDKKIKVGGKSFGVKYGFVGCNFMISREVLEVTNPTNIAPTLNFPPRWTSPWQDDGTWQEELALIYGFDHAYTRLCRPSLTDHIGVRGIHSKPGKYDQGIK